ncbi:hypothetical protein DICVIV_07850 [Dictyocaulus viviparus]|uniref:Uncharacterized protein n=1 Tax=Dictyocaulus viviparus TaxID=29172 RepID=A0A0D8XNF4_DICVI|nr:hypothetical protein DICVIV_07850 [Dictyocaulus viviparus]
MSKLRNLFRFAFAIVWCSSLYYDVKYQPRLGHEWYIYKLIMLTNMNFNIFILGYPDNFLNIGFNGVSIWWLVSVLSRLHISLHSISGVAGLISNDVVKFLTKLIIFNISLIIA